MLRCQSQLTQGDMASQYTIFILRPNIQEPGTFNSLICRISQEKSQIADASAGKKGTLYVQGLKMWNFFEVKSSSVRKCYLKRALYRQLPNVFYQLRTFTQLRSSTQSVRGYFQQGSEIRRYFCCSFKQFLSILVLTLCIKIFMD